MNRAAVAENFPAVAVLALSLCAGNLFYGGLETGYARLRDASGLAPSIKRLQFPFPQEFKGFISDWCYIQADQYFHDGAWTKIAPLLRLRAILMPERTNSWTTGAWHLAFNLSDQATDPAEHDRFIRVGIDFLNEGIRRHPDVAHLYFDLAWTYYMRRADYPSAIRFFKKSLDLEYAWRTVTWIAYMLHKSGRYAEEAEVWGDYLKRFPGDAKAQTHLESAREAQNLKTQNGGPA